MVPRSWFTNLADGAKVHAGSPVAARGIALGGDCGVKAVDMSADNGATWQPATLSKDEGPYSFRQWTAFVPAPQPGGLELLVRCTNTNGIAQPMDANWNGGGFMRNVCEHVQLAVG